MSTGRHELVEVMRTAMSSNSLETLTDINKYSIVAIALWNLDKTLFPFYEQHSHFYLNGGDNIGVDYKGQNRNSWNKILKCLAMVDIPEWKACIDEFQSDMLIRFLEGEEIGLLYFCLLFLMFFKEIAPMKFKQLENKYSAILNKYLDQSSQFKSGSKASEFMTPRSKKSVPYMTTSPESIDVSIRRGREHLVTDQSIQDLLKIISQRESDLQITREDLLAREKNLAELQDKLSQARSDVKQAKDELHLKEAMIYKLSFRIETLEKAGEATEDRVARHSLNLANNKIDDLYVEVEQLQRRNADLQHKYNQAILAKRIPNEQYRDNDLGDEEEKVRAEIRKARLENQILEDKVKNVELNNLTLSDKLLKEKEANTNYAQQFQQLHRVLTQKEINTKSLQNEKDAMMRENEHLKEKIINNEFQLKKQEVDYSNILKNGQDQYQYSKQSLPPTKLDPTGDANLELIRVCKEVNKSYLQELTCVYGLLHDSFVSELTGTSLHEIVRKRLEDEAQTRQQLPF